MHDKIGAQKKKVGSLEVFVILWDETKISKLKTPAQSYGRDTNKLHHQERIGLTLLSYIIKEKIKQLSSSDAVISMVKSMRENGVERRQYLSIFGLLHWGLSGKSSQRNAKPVE